MTQSTGTCAAAFSSRFLMAFPFPKQARHVYADIAVGTAVSSLKTAPNGDTYLVPSRRLSVRLSVCDAVHCGSQSRCTVLKVAPACS